MEERSAIYDIYIEHSCMGDYNVPRNNVFFIGIPGGVVRIEAAHVRVELVRVEFVRGSGANEARTRGSVEPRYALCWFACIHQTSASVVGIRQHMSACVGMCRHTSAGAAKRRAVGPRDSAGIYYYIWHIWRSNESSCVLQSFWNAFQKILCWRICFCVKIGLQTLEKWPTKFACISLGQIRNNIHNLCCHLDALLLACMHSVWGTNEKRMTFGMQRVFCMRSSIIYMWCKRMTQATLLFIRINKHYIDVCMLLLLPLLCNTRTAARFFPPILLACSNVPGNYVACVA